jgi:hypothetical protein
VKVVANTPDRLVLEQTGWEKAAVALMIVLILSWQASALQNMSGAPYGLFLLFGVGMIVYAILSIDRVQFWADRAAGTFVIRRRTILGLKEDIHPLTDLAGADLTSRRGNKGGRRYRCEIRLAEGGGPLPLTASFGGHIAATRAVNAINGWVGQPDSGWSA